MPLHVHDGDGVSPAADDKIFRIFWQDMDTVNVKAAAPSRASKRLERVGALRCLGIPHFDGAVRRGADDVVSVNSEDGEVDV